MKRLKFEFTPIAVVELSFAEVKALRSMAKNHYDYTCRALAEPGRDAIINGMYNHFDLDDDDAKTIEYRLTGRELDLLCKVCEQWPLTARSESWPEDHPGKALMFELLKLFNESQVVWREVNHHVAV